MPSISLPSIKTQPLEEIRLYSISRRLSQEFSVLDTSFDVYYRENPVRVPFLWESRPGTPKVGIRDFSLPPLTPPPSFHPTTPISRKPSKNQPRNNLITRVFLHKLKLKKTQYDQQYTPSRSSFSSSSSSSPWSMVSSPIDRHRVSDPPRMTSFGSRIDEEDDECESPVSTLCFGRRKSHGDARSSS
ncbi:hypothetical protein ACS0TY_008038 [Phlomoides rotata]